MRLLPERPRRLPARLRKAIAAISIAFGALAASIAVAPPAVASPSGDLAVLTNSARAAAGLPALGIDGQLSAVAQAWANQLASRNTLSHNPNLRGQVTNWSSLGENVGYSGDVPTVQKAFMNSPEHRANILNPKYTLMGVGSATSTFPSCGCTVIWVVVDFKRPQTTPAPPAPKQAPPAKQPVTAPAAQPRQPTQHPTQHTAAVTQHTAATTHAATSETTTPSQNTTSAATTSPSASASANALNTQLSTVSSGGDPVSRVLTFASVVSQLPS